MADVACAPERFRVVLLLTMDVDGGICLSRNTAKGSSGTEALGLLHTGLDFYQQEASAGFAMGGEEDADD